MCIIAAKHAGLAMPDERTIERMWHNNPDGAGFMYAKDGEVFIEKGFMSLKSFKAALDRVGNTVDLDATSVVMHFRITTHGGTKPENCHPFPVTDSMGKLKKLVQKTRLGVAHNGIINIFPRDKGISDTMEFIASIVAPLYKGVPNFLTNPHLMTMLYNSAESKLAFLNGKGEIVTVGHFEDDEGMLYSNTSYSYDRTKWLAPIYSYDYDLNDWTSSRSFAPEDDTYDGDIYEEYLMALNESKGEFVIDDKGQLHSGDDYYVDEFGTVYVYDEELGACRFKLDLSAFSSSGTVLRFDEKRAYMEVVYDDTYTTYTK